MTSNSSSPTVNALSALLASSYTLFLKTQNYHWNVTGPMFTTLHTLLETQYTELAAAIDEIAERIRALGAFAPGSLSAFSELSNVEEASRRLGDDSNSGADQVAIVAAAQKVIEAAEAAGDDASVDLGGRRLDIHQKNAWMLTKEPFGLVATNSPPPKCPCVLLHQLTYAGHIVRGI